VVVVGRAHVAGGPVVVALLNEADLFRFTLALQGDIINNVNAAVYELLFWQ
jgi:hypothetical protein